MNASFRQYAETFDTIEVLKVMISPEGEYSVPSEKKGRIAEVSQAERTRLRKFLLELCLRMDCAKLEPEEIAELRKTLGEFSNSLECPDPGHASEPKATPRKAAARG
jgi:hypothetical protein